MYVCGVGVGWGWGWGGVRALKVLCVTYVFVRV